MVKKNFLMTAPLLMASFCSAQEKPNVVLIMVDDMGYSDIGCYGGEILTPNMMHWHPKEYVSRNSTTLHVLALPGPV